jgi:hypothetical protein
MVAAPKCGYAVMKRGVNAVTGNLAVGLAAGLATGGLLGPGDSRIDSNDTAQRLAWAHRHHRP